MWKRGNTEKKYIIKIRPHYESEKSNKVNNELKLNVDEQQDDVEHLK